MGVVPRHSGISPMARSGVMKKARTRAGGQVSMRLFSQDAPPWEDRVLSLSPYLLPILDGVNYGRFLFAYFPAVSQSRGSSKLSWGPLVHSCLDDGVGRQVAAPIYAVLNPFLAVYKSSPFASLAIYLALVFIGRSTSLSRYVRFNIQQSILLDVALVLPSILFNLIKDAPLYVQEPLSNFFFFTLLACLAYIGSSIVQGEKPNQIPVVSEAAEMAVGPF
jgi:hypothetical protein